MTRSRRSGRWPARRPGSATASPPSSRSWPARSPAGGCAAPGRAARRQRGGQPARLAARLLDAATPGPAERRPRPGTRQDPELAAEIREATAKLASPQWETLIRYAVATTAAVVPDGAGRWRPRAAAAQAQARLRGLAHALASAFALLTGRNRLARRRLRHPAAALAGRRLARGDLLSVAELAALARLPADPALPGLARRRGAGRRAAARHPAPRPRRPAARHLRRRARRARSAWPSPTPGTTSTSCGPTGTGKSTLLTDLVLADADAGRGVVVIDPKGDVVTDLLDRLPEDVAGRSVLFDPDDPGARRRA